MIQSRFGLRYANHWNG